MPSQNPTRLPPPGGLFEGLAQYIKLILRLMGDRRVNFFLKILPVFSLVYLFFPDLVIGPLDDAAVMWLSLTLFVELCPPQVVEEHRRAIRAGKTAAQESPASKPMADDNVIEGEFREVSGPAEAWDNGFKKRDEN
jgi:hypothetical protein